MKITDISLQVNDQNRVNVFVDGVYRLSLAIVQVAELGLKVGREYSEEELASLEQESQFSKLYARALDYSLMRPRSTKEVRDYLKRKTYATRYKDRRTGELKERAGASGQLTERVFQRLTNKGYVDDEKFTAWWLESRHRIKGISRRKLDAELRGKGVPSEIIEQAMATSERDDVGELDKVVAKKRRRYDDDQKFIQYLARQGFRYDDIKQALSRESDD